MIERIPGRARCAAIALRAAAGVSRLMREIAAEISRLNRTGLSADALEGQSRRACARLVTAALSHRHDGRNRCC